MWDSSGCAVTLRTATADTPYVTIGRSTRLIGLLVAVTCVGACATNPAPRVLPPATAPGATVARTAQSFVGTPYKLGGADPSGFDCSGLVHYVYTRHGVTVPRDVKRQWQVGQPVGLSGIRAGDLLFFRTTGRGPTHVTIALDARSFVHAPSSRGVVRIESLASSYWSARFVGARRVIG